MLELAGLRKDSFTPHSTRAAPTTEVVHAVPLKTLLHTAGWRSRNVFMTSTTRKFRRKDPSLGLYCLEVNSYR